MASSSWLIEVAGLLQKHGFKKRAGGIFTREIAEDVIGWLGLNRASKHHPAGQAEVNPVVGIRHQAIERIVAELRGEKFHAYVPPTVSTPLGYVMPAASYRGWLLGAGVVEHNADDLVAAIEAFGVPFMVSGSSLPELCRLIGQGFGYDHQLVYRYPVAWILAGDLARAQEVLEAAEADLGSRTDAAAIQFRSFSTAFRNRFAASSSSGRGV